MLKQFRPLIFAAFTVAALLYVPLSFAQDEPRMDEPQMVDINEYTCKDIVRMSGENRDMALAVLHGYMLGKKGALNYDSAKLSKASNDFIEHCLEHPSDKALETFAKFVE